MLLECTECQLPYYDYEDLQEHYAVTHPKLYRLHNRLDVRIVKRILNRHQKTYRCSRCFMPFPDPALRDSHLELEECDPEDDSDCEREPGLYGTLRRGRVDSIVNKWVEVEITHLYLAFIIMSSSDSDQPLNLRSLAASLPASTIDSESPTGNEGAVKPHLRRKPIFLQQNQDQLVKAKLQSALKAHATLKRKVQEELTAGGEGMNVDDA
ncbi:hypothetical protein C8F01DRAFT_1245780 [Mycena amicta]|nr:hypothetical protein C8F01DRAFT_1245780 [Mycena amicta]